MNSALPRVLFVSLGGTIAMTRSEPAQGVTPTLDADDLVRAAPELQEVAEINVLPAQTVPGAHLKPDDLLTLVARIREQLDGAHAGVVVAQGTDTIEETAFLLDLALDVDEPVVVTGAMRSPALTSPDGPANLLASTQVAACAEARGLGVLVVLNEQIHAARHVRKTHASNLATFVSDPGALGWVSEGRPRVLLRPVSRLSLPAPPAGEEVPVALVIASLGDDGRLLDGLTQRGFGGLVIEALGGGHLPEAMAERVVRLAEDVPVVLTTRTKGGEGLRRTYGFPGSERDLIERGLISGGWLDGPKARVLLMLLLRSGMARDGVEAGFSDVLALSGRHVLPAS